MQGIYCIHFNCNNFQYYIGESTNIGVRLTRHLSDLKNSRHVNPQLQSGYNKYGDFEVLILEEILDDSTLGIREKYWIEVFNSFREGMNRTIGGEGCSFGEVHPSAVLTNEQYLSIVNMLAYTDNSIQEISEGLNVPKSIVSNISTGKSACFLAQAIPEAYELMRNRVGTRAKGPIPMTASFLSPLGMVYTTSNLKDFSETHGIDYSGLYKLVRRERKSAKGWTLI